MHADLKTRWDNLWRRLKAPPPSGLLEILDAHYSENHRAYHNLRHIGECLVEFNQHRALAVHPDGVEMAIWFHDVVYDPKAKDNEEASATLAGNSLRGGECPEECVVRVEQLILATKHTTAPPDRDSMLMVDIDLSILGREASRFDEYESAIRKEYDWVPIDVYVRERSKVLQRFLDRPRIYSSDPFRLGYETVARENLRRSISQLAREKLS